MMMKMTPAMHMFLILLKWCPLSSTWASTCTRQSQKRGQRRCVHSTSTAWVAVTWTDELPSVITIFQNSDLPKLPSVFLWPIRAHVAKKVATFSPKSTEHNNLLNNRHAELVDMHRSTPISCIHKRIGCRLVRKPFAEECGSKSILAMVASRRLRHNWNPPAEPGNIFKPTIMRRKMYLPETFIYYSWGLWSLLFHVSLVETSRRNFNFSNFSTLVISWRLFLLESLAFFSRLSSFNRNIAKSSMALI